MRWRLGLLQDAAAVEKQAAREAAQDAAKKHKQSIPTVKTEAQMKADQESASKSSKTSDEPSKPKSQPKVRPLSEAKAIESGANFISETFLFGVAASLIFFESWRSRRKESNRRDDVAERIVDLEESERAARRALVELEREVLRLRAKEGPSTLNATKRILPKEVYEAEAKDEEEVDNVSKGWMSRIASFISREDSSDKEAKEALASNSPGPAEKILVKSDQDLDQRQKQRQIDAEAQQTTITRPTITASSAQ